jgi:hypothetical protein
LSSARTHIELFGIETVGPQWREFLRRSESRSDPDDYRGAQETDLARPRVRVLVDYHHHDLWESLELLFTDRFGWELLRPIGMDWFEQGYWNHERKWHGDAIARQYLEPWGSDVSDLDGRLSRLDTSHNRVQRLVTLEQARELRPDIVISTLAHNHEGLARFAAEVGATFGLQIGNVRFGAQDMAEDRWDLADFGLVSGVMPLTPPKPHVTYHQEFVVPEYDAAVPRTFDGRANRRFVMNEEGAFRVSSFVQCYPETDWAYKWMTDTAAVAPELDWRVYGAYGQAPARPVRGRQPRRLRLRPAGHASAPTRRGTSSAGRTATATSSTTGSPSGAPVFGFESYYRDQLAGPLWVEGVTSYNVEGRTPAEIAALLRELRDDEDKHNRMCEAAAARFREIVNFDAEADQIRRLLEGVLP